MCVILDKKQMARVIKLIILIQRFIEKWYFWISYLFKKILQICKISIYDEIRIGYNNGNNGESVMEQVSYKKLFKLLIDKDLKKTEFAVKAGISQNTLARMGKGQFISMELLVRICRYLNCTFDDVVEIIDKEN